MTYNEKDLRNKAEAYIQSEEESVFRLEVEEDLAKENWEGLYDRFYTSLSFGTAGLRGILGGGTNRMNSFIIRKVTQALSD